MDLHEIEVGKLNFHFFLEQHGVHDDQTKGNLLNAEFSKAKNVTCQTLKKSFSLRNMTVIPRPISMEENYGATLVLGKKFATRWDTVHETLWVCPYSRLAARTSCVALAYGELIDSNTPAYLVECGRQCISIVISIVIFNVRRGKNPPTTSLYYMDYWITGLLLPLVLGIDNEFGLMWELDLGIFIYINDMWVTGVFIYIRNQKGDMNVHH